MLPVQSVVQKCKILESEVDPMYQVSYVSYNDGLIKTIQMQYIQYAMTPQLASHSLNFVE